MYVLLLKQKQKLNCLINISKYSKQKGVLLMLHDIILTIFEHFNSNSSSKKTSPLLNKKISDIKNNCDLFPISMYLDKEDTENFIKAYLNYMYSHENSSVNTVLYFTRLIHQMLEVSKKLEDPAIRFLNNFKDNDFKKGFLLHDTY